MYTSPLMGATYGKNNSPFYNPQEIELMTKQKYINPPLTASDPYMELMNIMGNCSGTVRANITNNPEYKEVEAECDMLIKQTMEELIVPQVLNKPNGRMAFEKMVAIAKKLRDKYSQEEIAVNEQFQKLMQDEVVQKRLQELSKADGTN